MRPRILLIAIVAAVLIPAVTRADDRPNDGDRREARTITIQDVIDLARSNVGDDVIESQIDASGVVFTLTVQDILDLKKAGVSDRIITYMINTGKDDGERTDRSSRSEDSGYHSGVDSRYRGYNGYDNDPNWNIYLSWGFGRYYDPWYYTWWPDYTYYYYPVTCLRPYWPYYPYYHHYYDAGNYSYRDRTFRDGRHVFGRGGERQAPGDGSRPSAPGPRRAYKGDSSGRGSSGSNPPESGSSGRTIKPGYGGRGGDRPAPQPGRGGSNPKSGSSSSGRTIKKS